MFSLNSFAAIFDSYLLFNNGNVSNLGFAPGTRWYENENGLNQENYWIFNDVANTVQLAGIQGNGVHTLNTSLFSVKDITDVTFAAGNQAIISTTLGSYLLYNDGRVANLGYVPGTRRYENETAPNRRNYWEFNDVANTVQLVGISGGGVHVLNTSLFSVKDITDVTYSNDYQAIINTSLGSFLLYNNGNVGNLGFAPGTRWYENENAPYRENYWEFNDVKNTVQLIGNNGAGVRTLNTNLFSVKDIADVTYSNDYQAIITVRRAEPANSVPEPSPLALTLLALTLMLGYSKSLRTIFMKTLLFREGQRFPSQALAVTLT
jgi:hypothetical protein